jgi:hypothetical protein
VARIAARLAVVVLALAMAGCGGGGGNGDSDPEHAGVAAFPDILEIARAELGDDAALHEVTVSETEITFVNAQFGRNVRVRYGTDAVFIGNAPVRKKLNPAAVFPIAGVPRDGPSKLLAAIREREGGDVEGFSATLARNAKGELLWNAKATVGGAPKTFEAALDGTLR